MAHSVKTGLNCLENRFSNILIADFVILSSPSAIISKMTVDARVPARRNDSL
jgi:hypothetical protein